MWLQSRFESWEGKDSEEVADGVYCFRERRPEGAHVTAELLTARKSRLNLRQPIYRENSY
jgi:hypothetical protein